MPPAGWAASRRCLPLIADCERGVGRPERAIELARSPEAAQLTGDDADELRIVVAGARSDLGTASSRRWRFCRRRNSIRRAPDRPPPGCSTPTPKRCSRSAATEEALQWFINAAAADVEGVTDAEERITELA